MARQGITGEIFEYLHILGWVGLVVVIVGVRTDKTHVPAISLIFYFYECTYFTQSGQTQPRSKLNILLVHQTDKKIRSVKHFSGKNKEGRVGALQLNCFLCRTCGVHCIY